MTTSREVLNRISKAYGFTPHEWQYRLAELTSPMTVCGLFRTAIFEPGLLSEVLVIPPDLRHNAKQYMRQVAMARGKAVTLYEIPREKDTDSTWYASIIQMKFPVKQSQPEKIDGRSTKEARQRMATAQKKRWKDEQKKGMKRRIYTKPEQRV